MVEKLLLTHLIEAEAIQFGDFVLASGKKSTVYVDIKKAITDPIILRTIAQSVMALKLPFDLVAGVAVGGVPLATAVSLESGRPYCIIRKEQKGHGLSSLIIGDVRGNTALMIEDVTTSGGSALFGVEQIRAAGGIITSIVTVVDRDEGATEMLASSGITLIPLVSMSDLLKEQKI
ncbi:MAG TPA: orotate phosphoribosyltransferase [Methanospirillum sp.]|nr:orotate phosphoribosyltransferase [Methanospirillum sp.]